MSGRFFRVAIPVLLASAGFLAAPARAQAPSIRPGMPPEVMSLRTTILTREDYTRLAEEWGAYTRAHPDVAVGYVEQYRALRYANQGSPKEREDLLRKALDVDPDCPEALEQMAGWMHAMTRDRAEGIRLAERAVTLAPSWAEPHFILTSFALADGRRDEARKHLGALIEKGGMPAPVIDFGYNLLVSAEPNAIVFTNGDNDTYPPLALQAVRGIRADVTIVNLSLLNIGDYAVSVWKEMTPRPAPFTESAVRGRLAAWEAGEAGKGAPFAQLLFQDIIDRVKSGLWQEPVYLAVTVSPNYQSLVEGRAALEGILWRVKPDSWPGPAADVGTPPIDAARTLRIFREEMRLDSATDLGYPWGPTSSVAKLMLNYPAVLQAAAPGAAARGDMAGVDYAMSTAIAMLDFHGETEKARALAGYWKELDPGAKVPDRWK